MNVGLVDENWELIDPINPSKAPCKVIDWPSLPTFLPFFGVLFTRCRSLSGRIMLVWLIGKTAETSVFFFF